MVCFSRVPVSLVILIALTLSACTAANDPGSDVFWISNVNVVDVEAKRIVAAQDIGIAEGRIKIIRDHAPATSGFSYDAGGAFAVAGLYDAHTHIDTSARLELMLPELSGMAVETDEIDDDLAPYLLYGITGIVVLNGNDEILAARERAASPDSFMPRILVSSPILDGPDAGNPVHVRIDSPAAGRAAVDDAVAHGYDLIKTYHIDDKPSRDAIIARAVERGLPVAGHIPPGMPFADALVPGFGNVAHAEEITRLWDGEDETYLASAVDLMATNGISLTPNLVAYREIADETEDIEGRLATLDWELTPPLARLYASPPNNGYVNDFGGDDTRDRAAAYFRRIATAMDRVTLNAHDTGVLLLAGTDTGNPTMLPGQGLYRELHLLRDAGLDGYDALAAATLNVARFFAEESDRGSVSVGKVADLVLFRVNPVDNVLSRESVRAVLKGGVLLDESRIAGEVARIGDAYDQRETRYRRTAETQNPDDGA